MRAVVVLPICLIAAASCDARTLPPHGEALIVVDTDAVVPQIAGRLRLDLYAPEGTWLESRDIPRPSRDDWPASFSVWNPDMTRPRVVIVRLRTYPEGKLRDYHGERFSPRPSKDPPEEIPAPAPAPGGEQPRLRIDGVDRTPLSEPQPLVTIDRLLRVTLEPGRRGRVIIVLRGACAGTMAHLSTLETCIDRENERSPVPDAVLEPDMTRPMSSQSGTFGPRVDCSEHPRPGSDWNGAPLFDEEVCVPGGSFVLGNADRFGDDLAGIPERVAIVPPVRMDRYEVSVGRWRKAVADGFRSPDSTPITNKGPLANREPDVTGWCTYSDQPFAGNQSRETYPLNCVSWEAARAFCRFEGGDLPSEAEWEWAAQASERPFKTRYPWGDDEPTCDRTVFGRIVYVGGGDQCLALGYLAGPQAIAPADLNPDISLGAGIVDLGGGLAEMTADASLSLGTRCWTGAPLASPSCVDDPLPRRSTRGGSWDANSIYVASGVRTFGETQGKFGIGLGLRCVRPGG